MKKTGSETTTVTRVTKKQIEVHLRDSILLPKVQVHIEGLMVGVDSAGLPVMAKKTVKQGRSTATVSITGGKLQLDVKSDDSTAVFDRVVPVQYNDSSTVTTTVITQEKVPTFWGKIASFFFNKIILTFLVSIAAALLCYKLFKRAK